MNIVGKIIRILSKTEVIILMVIILIIALGAQVFQQSLIVKRTSFRIVTTMISPTVEPFQLQPRIQSGTGKVKKVPDIDLNKSYICNTASTSAFIKSKKVRVTNRKKSETDNLIFDGDCVYLWEDGDAKGTRTCGYGQYVVLYETLGKGLSLNAILPYIDAFGKSVGKNGSKLSAAVDVEAFADSCRESIISDPNLFSAPTGVTFANTK